MMITHSMNENGTGSSRSTATYNNRTHINNATSNFISNIAESLAQYGSSKNSKNGNNTAVKSTLEKRAQSDQERRQAIQILVYAPLVFLIDKTLVVGERIITIEEERKSFSRKFFIQDYRNG